LFIPSLIFRLDIPVPRRLTQQLLRYALLTNRRKPDRLDTKLERVSNRLGAWSLFEREGPAEAWPLGTR
jgi:hypothetical protein